MGSKSSLKLKIKSLQPNQNLKKKIKKNLSNRLLPSPARRNLLPSKNTEASTITKSTITTTLKMILRETPMKSTETHVSEISLLGIIETNRKIFKQFNSI